MNLTIKEFMFKNISVSIIISLISARVIGSFFENVFNGIFYYLTPDEFFFNLNKLYNVDKKKIPNKEIYSKNKDSNSVKFGIYYGNFFRDFIIWLSIMSIFYICMKSLSKLNEKLNE